MKMTDGGAGGGGDYRSATSEISKRPALAGTAQLPNLKEEATVAAHPATGRSCCGHLPTRNVCMRVPCADYRSRYGW